MNASPGRFVEAEVDGHTARIQVRDQPGGGFQVNLDGRALTVDARAPDPGFLSLLIDGRSYLAGLERQAAGYTVTIGRDAFEVVLRAVTAGVSAAPRPATGPARLKAPMPGKIVRVLVELGEVVAAAQGLVVMEAMKMENELRAPRAGRVCELHVQQGQTVEAGQPIAVVE